MAEKRPPLIRGRISLVDTYASPQQGGGTPTLPKPDPATHSAQLLTQISAIEERVERRPSGARDELATREIVAIRPAPGAELTADQLDDAKSDARLIGIIPDSGTVLIDAADPRLGFLRKKIAAFADDTRVKTTDRLGRPISPRRDKARAVAPIGAISLADAFERTGPRLLAESIKEEKPYWFALLCRGGYRRPTAGGVGVDDLEPCNRSTRVR